MNQRISFIIEILCNIYFLYFPNSLKQKFFFFSREPLFLECELWKVEKVVLVYYLDNKYKWDSKLESFHYFVQTLFQGVRRGNDLNFGKFNYYYEIKLYYVWKLCAYYIIYIYNKLNINIYTYPFYHILLNHCLVGVLQVPFSRCIVTLAFSDLGLHYLVYFAYSTFLLTCFVPD